MLFTFLVLLFILLSGKITGEILVFSILSSFVISVFTWKFLGWTRQKDFGCIKRLPAALGYAWVLLREIIKANLAVMLLIIRGTQPRAIIVRFSSNLRSGLLQTVLANSITIFCLSPAGFTGALMQVLFHGLSKVCLFLCAGAIIHKSGSEYVRDAEGRMLTAGIAKQLPLLMWAFALASLSLIGIPPLAGFAGKWQLMNGAFQAMGNWAWLGAGVLLISALFTAGYLMDIVSSAFFSKPASAEDHCGRQSPVMDMPVIIMAFLLLLLGIFAILYADSFQNLASALALGV